LNPETGTTSEGEAELLSNLVEATALYIEENPLPLGERFAWLSEVGVGCRIACSAMLAHTSIPIEKGTARNMRAPPPMFAPITGAVAMR
jgi:hypothetical protein